MMAAEKGNSAMVGLLLEAGAGIFLEQRDLSGATALLLACQSFDVATIRLLLNARASVAVANNEGWTPLMMACETSDIKLLVELLQRGADINAQSKDNGTAIHLAARAGNRELAQFLVDNRASVNVKTEGYDSTPLMDAVLGGHMEMVQYLLTVGAKESLYVPDNSGKTVVQVARDAGRIEIAEFLQGEMDKLESDKKKAVDVQAIPGDAILHQYQATERVKDPKEQLLSQIGALKILVDENPDKKEEAEEIIFAIRSLQKQQFFTSETELPSGKTIAAEIVEALGEHLLVNRLKEIFVNKSLTLS